MKIENLPNQWFAIDEKIRFIIAGICNMGIRYVVFVILGLMFGIGHYQLILLAAWFFSSFIAFFSYKILVFQTEGNHLKEYGKSLLIWTLSYFINAFLLEGLAAGLGWNVYLAQALAIVIITVVNYLLFKYFAFAERKKSWLEHLYNLWE